MCVHITIEVACTWAILMVMKLLRWDKMGPDKLFKQMVEFMDKHFGG